MQTTATVTAVSYATFRAFCAHTGIVVVTPQDPSWDEARLAWNLHADQRPVAVAFPETADDVAAIVDLARDAGLRVAPQGTGHNATAITSLDDTILLKTERMQELTIDPATRTARAGAGVLWADVVNAAAEHGLAALAGSSPDVGVVGYTLGGGLSFLARKHGLAANKVTAIELVTADGRHVRTTEHNEPDLFWALRGGGGSFGAVTAIEFELLPLTEVYAGMLAFPIERASEVLHAWREWTHTVPDEVSSVGRILRVPPLPDIPEPVRGRELAVIEVVAQLSEEDGAKLVEPLRALGAEIDTIATVPPVALQHLHMDPEHPVAGVSTTMLLRDLPAEAIDALVDVAGPGKQVPLLSIEIRQLGGVLGRPDASHGALGTLDAEFIMFGVGMAITPEMAAGVQAYNPLLNAAFAPYEADRAYSNFVEAPTDGDALFGAAHERLRAVKAQYDPADLFRSNHPVEPAS